MSSIWSALTRSPIWTRPGTSSTSSAPGSRKGSTPTVSRSLSAASIAIGMAHIGIIRVLEREGIPIDMVVGSSMGALIAGIWSVGNNASELEKFGKEFEIKSAVAWKLYDPPLWRALILFSIALIILFK